MPEWKAMNKEKLRCKFENQTIPGTREMQFVCGKQELFPQFCGYHHKIFFTKFNHLSLKFIYRGDQKMVVFPHSTISFHVSEAGDDVHWP